MPHWMAQISPGDTSMTPNSVCTRSVPAKYKCALHSRLKSLMQMARHVKAACDSRADCNPQHTYGYAERCVSGVLMCLTVLFISAYKQGKATVKARSGGSVVAPSWGTIRKSPSALQKLQSFMEALAAYMCMAYPCLLAGLQITPRVRRSILRLASIHPQYRQLAVNTQ